MPATIEPERIKLLNDRAMAANGDFVLYWMQQSQREAHNPALEYSVGIANSLGLPVIVVFVLMEDYPEANERHFAFMLQGLEEVARGLKRRRIPLLVRGGDPQEVVVELAHKAAALVCDRGYLRHQRDWRELVSRLVGCQVIQVEGDVVVPVDLVSDHVEYAARTIRPKILRLRDDFLRPVARARLRKPMWPCKLAGDFDPANADKLLATLEIDRSVPRVARFKGGTTQARKHVNRFSKRGLVDYAEARNDPAEPRCSTLSPYLHFGQISPVEVARKVAATESCSQADREAFLEQLIVRRELSINYVLHEPRFDSYSAIPEWAKRTLHEHRGDQRPYRYTRSQLEAASTHDPYWNAAMLEMLKTGYMHNYMRMYWGKKIIEWSSSPQQAFRIIINLNNKYFIDGRDPNSYTSVAWLFGLHDRPWTERAEFGKIRYMNAGGLERKFDIQRYVRWAGELVS